MELNVNFGDEYINPNNIVNANFYHTVYYISGLVTETVNDIPKASCRVRAYNRQTGELLGQDISDDYGNFYIELPSSLDLIYVTCEDETDYNALIIDRVTPRTS